MRKFILKLLLFIAPLAAFLAWWEHGLAGMANDHKTKAAQLEAAKSRCELLVLGSSHEQSSFSSASLRHPTVNLACGYQTLQADARLAAHVLPQLPALKHVILGISYHTLEGPPASLTVGKPLLATAYHKYYGLPHDRWTDALDIKNFSMIAWYGIPLSTTHLKQGFREKTSSGTAPAVPYEFTAETGRRRIEHHHAEMNPTNREANRATLLRTIALLKNARVTPILITSPCHATYRDHMNPETYATMQTLISNVCRETGAQYFNHLADPRFDTADFHDTDHLNARGAEKFRQIVETEILPRPR